MKLSEKAKKWNIAISNPYNMLCRFYQKLWVTPLHLENSMILFFVIILMNVVPKKSIVFMWTVVDLELVFKSNNTTWLDLRVYIEKSQNLVYLSFFMTVIEKYATYEVNILKFDLAATIYKDPKTVLAQVSHEVTIKRLKIHGCNHN